MRREKLLKSAKAYLENSIITDAVVGISLVSVEIDNTEVGVSYTLRESLPAGCSAFNFHTDFLGSNAYISAEKCLMAKDALSQSVAMAIINAANTRLNLKDVTTKEAPFGIYPKKTDTLGMVGYIVPVAKMLEPQVGKMYVFDKGISTLGSFHKEINAVTSMDKQAELLGECDIVFLSGTTLLNGTFEELNSNCKKAREIVMLGSSTPMYPEAFRDTKVTMLAGSHWNRMGKKEIFKRISLGSGIRGIEEFMEKRCVALH